MFVVGTADIDTRPDIDKQILTNEFIDSIAVSLGLGGRFSVGERVVHNGMMERKASGD